MQIMLWFAGIRGAIAFALSLNVDTDHRGYIITATLMIVFFTTIICGGMTETMLTSLELRRTGLNPLDSPSSDDNPTDHDHNLLSDNQDMNDRVVPSVRVRQYTGLH
eukprot:UN22690